MAKSKYQKSIEEKLQILKEEKQKTDSIIAKQKKSLMDLQIIKYKIEGAIFTLNQILNKD